MAANKSTTTSIYVIRSEAGPIKIGLSSDPRARLYNFQVASHQPLFLDYTAMVVAGDARRLESYTHEILKDYSTGGEWFAVSCDQAIDAIFSSAETVGCILDATGLRGAPRPKKRLTANAVTTLSKPGRHADGDNLYLTITSTPGGISKRWTFLYKLKGRQREAGFGSAAVVTLAEAREKAAGYRAVLSSGEDPLELKMAATKVSAARRWVEDMKAAAKW
jgi:hypothetical protein